VNESPNPSNEPPAHPNVNRGRTRQRQVPSSSTTSQRIADRPQDRSAGDADKASKRLRSLDVYRGLIMVMLASAGFGIAELASLPADAPVWKQLDYEIWQDVAVHFRHAEWTCDFDWIGVPFWDMIQPAFMFMVGVSMPFSFRRRAVEGHSGWRRTAHALWRAIVLVLLGVFLSSNWASQTNWVFVNVLSQIGLGYLFVYLLMQTRYYVQLAAFVLILVGYWGFFFAYPPSANYDYQSVGASENTVFEGRFAAWSKNANAAHKFDVWLLNLFPRPQDDRFEYNRGGYQTLNFVPSIGTMLLGLFCGQLLTSERRWWQKFLLLVLGGALCLGLGVLAGEYACPIVKRIWTPSWVLFSGGWVIWGLALCYLVFDLLRLGWLAFPLAIVGMNSLAMYMMGQMLRPWAIKTVKIHFLGLMEQPYGPQVLADNMFGHLIWPTAALLVFWLIVLWMYRQKFFVRV
jgi:heparan-alpha-glucosaminide N-acetyltransferase